MIGTGPDLNSATDNGLERAAELLGMEVPEVKNRATISGAIEIGRHPGVVQVTFRAPLEGLEPRGRPPPVRGQQAGAGRAAAPAASAPPPPPPTSFSCPRMSGTFSTSSFVKNLTRCGSESARIMWLTPAGSMSDLIFSTHSSGVPASDSFST